MKFLTDMSDLTEVELVCYMLTLALCLVIPILVQVNELLKINKWLDEQ